MPDITDFKLIYNWADIEERPNFIPSIAITNDEDAKNKLEKIIAPYQFLTKVRCGISCCNTKHNHGFLVKLKTNEEIIIGKDCGKKYFGAEFNAQHKLMNTLRTESEYFKIIEKAYDKLDEMKENYMHILIPLDSLGIHKIIRELKKLNTANETINYWMIKELAQSDRITFYGEISQKIIKTDEEIEKERELKITSQNEIYDRSSDQVNIFIEPTKIVKIARVENFEIVYKTFEIEKLVKYFDEIHKKIKPPIEMKKEDRKKLVKELREYENNLYEIKNFSKKGNIFFDKDNLMKLQYVFKNSDSKEIIRKWAESIKE